MTDERQHILDRCSPSELVILRSLGVVVTERQMAVAERRAQESRRAERERREADAAKRLGRPKEVLPVTPRKSGKPPRTTSVLYRSVA